MASLVISAMVETFTEDESCLIDYKSMSFLQVSFFTDISLGG